MIDLSVLATSEILNIWKGALFSAGEEFCFSYGLWKRYQKRKNLKEKCQHYKLLLEYYISEMMIQIIVYGKLANFFSGNLTKI